MTEYFSKDLCQKLDKMGVACGNHDMYVGKEVWNETMQSDYETESTQPRSTWVKAYDFASIMRPEALMAVFGEQDALRIGLHKEGYVEAWAAEHYNEKNHKYGKGASRERVKTVAEGDWEYWKKTGKVKPEYIFHAHQLLDAYLDGGLQAVEQYLLEYLGDV